MNGARRTATHCQIPNGTRQTTRLPANAGWFIALVFFAMAGAAMAAPNMPRVAVTGFNRDVVIEKTASGPPYSNYAHEFNLSEGKAYYQSGLSGQTHGLPSAGQFTNATDGTVFQFPSYSISI